MAPPIIDVDNAIGKDGAKALTVTLRALDVVGAVCRLVDAGKDSYSDEGNGIDGGFEGEFELQLRRERLGVGLIDDVEIGDDAENALLLLRF